MIPNDALLSRLRAEGYQFKRQGDRVCIYKQRGSTKIVTVRRHGNHDPDYVGIVLRQAGLGNDEVEAFIANYRRLN